MAEASHVAARRSRRLRRPIPTPRSPMAVGPLPVWPVHGDVDRTVSVEQSHHMYGALKGAHAEATPIAISPSYALM
jgi:hypothetical protein